MSKLKLGVTPNVSVNKQTGCWEWTAGKLRKGYGSIRFGGGSGVVLTTHRVSYQLFCGSIPKGMCVCHHCDNPSCINPDHLFLGTNADNMADKMAKRRNWAPCLRGSAHGQAKITEADVLAIRSEKGAKLRDLAAKYGISLTNISYIRRGLTWKHVDFGAKT